LFQKTRGAGAMFARRLKEPLKRRVIREIRGPDKE
jgi:hypothetical protein